MLNFHINASLRYRVLEVKEIRNMTISFSVKIAAEQCGLSERTIHAAIKQGDLKAMRVGRRVLITPAALDDYLLGKTNKSKAGAK
jgi:excisionase family DNA binding protein